MAWSVDNDHSLVPAITAFEDNSIVAAANTGHNGYDSEGTQSWYITSDSNFSAAVSEGGIIYTTGRYKSDISNAIFAYSWNTGPSTGWYRGNGNNQNTRWAASK